VHVVLRVTAGLPRLRTRTMYGVIRRVLERYLGRRAFRIVHLSIQSNHLHFIMEAADRVALMRGMQSLAITCARALNRRARRQGKVFVYRYHATQITTARQARSTLAYVLNNWRKHREDLFNATTMKAAVDPYSSGISFTGWKGVKQFARPVGYAALPVSPPTTRLLASDWCWHGAIDPFECPGRLL